MSAFLAGWNDAEPSKTGPANGTQQLIGMLRNANLRWLTPGIIPPVWFLEFQDAASPEIEAAISGKQTVRQAIDKMAAKAEALQAE